MATSLVKVNGTEVSVKDSGKTVVNINICQESSLSYLVKAVAAAGQKWFRQKAPDPKTLGASAPAPSPGRAQCTGEQKVLGGSQILLGILCVGLGGVLCIFEDYMNVVGTGAPFWMGSLFVVSGSLCVLSERRGGCSWVLLATFFNLASVVAGSVALAFSVEDLPYTRNRMPYWIDNACKREESSPFWEPTRTPVNDWRVARCRDRMLRLLNIVSGVQILLVIFSVAAVGIAFFCLGYGLRVLCCSLQADSEGYVAVGDLEAPCPEELPPYEEPAKANTAA